jgi:hypothetical protein
LLARDPKFRDLASALVDAARRSESGSDEVIVDFLEQAFALPSIWKLLKDKPRDRFAQAKKDLHGAASAFLNTLHRDSDLVTLYLSGLSEAGEPHTSAKQRYERLVAAVTQIQQVAKAGYDVVTEDDLPKVPRKRNAASAHQLFFLQNLVLFARRHFGNPLYKEVGQLAALCLHLPSPIPPREVMEYCRVRSKAAIRSKK